MNQARIYITRYQLPVFFLLSYLLSWWTVPFMHGMIFPYGPMLAALIVSAVTGGRQGVAKWWHAWTNWRVAWYWYLVGPAFIFGYQGLAYFINLRLGAAVANPIAPPSGVVVLQLLVTGGQWEEPGWTGYALPKILNRSADRSGRNEAFNSVLILGVLRAFWHLPLYFYGHILWFDIFIFVITFQIIIAWLFKQSGGSLPVVMLFHFASNLIGATMSPVFTNMARTTYYALFMGIAVLIALIIAAFPQTLGTPQSSPVQNPAMEAGK